MNITCLENNVTLATSCINIYLYLKINTLPVYFFEGHPALSFLSRLHNHFEKYLLIKMFVLVSEILIFIGKTKISCQIKFSSKQTTKLMVVICIPISWAYCPKINKGYLGTRIHFT